MSDEGRRVESIPTGLPDVAPISWATRAGGMLFTAHVPIRADGSFETGDFERQCALAFENLRKAVEAAGGAMRDVAQVIVYLTDVADAPAVSAEWTRVFSPPYPNRAVLGCPALTVPGMKIELTAIAVLGD